MFISSYIFKVYKEKQELKRDEYRVERKRRDKNLQNSPAKFSKKTDLKPTLDELQREEKQKELLRRQKEQLRREAEKAEKDAQKLMREVLKKNNESSVPIFWKK